MSRVKPQDWVGLEYTMNSGEVVKIIAARNCHDIDIQFSDGAIIKSIDKSRLHAGNVLHPSVANLRGDRAREKRLHETKMMKSKLRATIIVYRNSSDIDVEFEDGTIMQHQTYQNFKTGCLWSHGRLHHANLRNERNGLTNVNCNGLSMQVKYYKNSHEVVVLFEDGHECITKFSKFESGQVPHPTNRKNHTSFPEMAIFYYLQKIGFLKYPKGYLNKYDVRWKRMELDAFNEKKKYAVEYDGEYAHIKASAQHHDVLKQELCDKEGIRLIKIREFGLPMHTNTNVIVRYRKSDLLELNDIIRQILEDYNQYTGESVAIDVDIMRDRRDIIELFTQSTQKRNDRIGTTVKATNGMMMTIIGYARYNQMTVQFEDGAIVDGIEYRWFMKGMVGHPKDKPGGRVGETKVSKWGEKMTIIEWEDSRHIKIQFDNGDVIETTSHIFNHNGIQSPTYKQQRYQNRIGETRKNTKGQTMRVIAYRSHHDIDVQFETGEIREHMSYSAFCNGTIATSPKQKSYTADDVLGAINKAKNGQLMTVTAFRTGVDIDVTFEDGTVVPGVRYGNFLTGCIKNPNYKRPKPTVLIPQAKVSRTDKQREARLHQTYMTKDGDSFTIVEYINSKNITIRFADGIEKYKVRFQDIAKNKVNKPGSKPHYVRSNTAAQTVRNIDSKSMEHVAAKTSNNVSIITINRVGEIHYNRMGERMLITQYQDSKHVTVQFDNGCIKENCMYGNIVNGHVKNPKPHLGESGYNTQGERMRIVDENGCMDVTVEFDDGARREHVRYAAFRRGSVPKNGIEGLKQSWRDAKCGETILARNQRTMMIVECLNANDCTIQWDDDSIQYHVDYTAFRNGRVAYHPDKIPTKMHGETVYTDVIKKGKPVIPNGQYYVKSEITGTDATMEIIGNDIVIKAGSVISYNMSPKVKPGIHAARQALQVDDHRRVIQDMKVSSVTCAASVALGHYAKGWEVWRTDNGQPISIYQ